ncbi:MAG: hypothetical protein M1281_20075 [Chloroflexi bacterium]|nr:hypothetical protein [Chloroflexota bacterium]
MIPHKLLSGRFGLALAFLLLTACNIPPAAPVSPTSTPTRSPPTATPVAVVPTPTIPSAQVVPFPYGLFDCVECLNMTTRYLDDGTSIVYLQGAKYITGKWRVDGDVFFTGDSFCGDADTMPASYNWHFDGEILTLQVIEDGCADRVSSLDGKPWRLVEE